MRELVLNDSLFLQYVINSQWPKQSAEARCSSVSGPLRNSGGLSSAAVCASRHNGPFRWRAHQHIHRLIPSIVLPLQDWSFIQTQLSWKGEKAKRRGVVSEEKKKKDFGWGRLWVDAAMRKTERLGVRLWETEPVWIDNACSAASPPPMGVYLAVCLQWY